MYKTVTIKIDKTTRVKYKMSIIRHSTIIKTETTLGPKTLNTWIKLTWFTCEDVSLRTDDKYV